MSSKNRVVIVAEQQFLYSVKVGGNSSFKSRSLNKIYKFTFKICWVELTEVVRLKLMAICITLYLNWEK